MSYEQGNVSGPDSSDISGVFDYAQPPDSALVDKVKALLRKSNSSLRNDSDVTVGKPADLDDRFTSWQY